MKFMYSTWIIKIDLVKQYYRRVFGHTGPC